MTNPDLFTHAVGDRRGSQDAVVAPVLAPEIRARQLARRLDEEPPTSRTRTPAETLHAIASIFQLSASPLATRPATHGLLLVFELRGHYSAMDSREACWRGVLTWNGASWELFERAVAVVP